MSKPPLVQAEFFHVGAFASSIEEVEAECVERIEEALEDILTGMPGDFILGPKIKTCVRFFDYDGSLTDFVSECESLCDREIELVGPMSSQKGMGRWILNLRLRRVVRRIAVFNARRHGIAFERLETCLRGRLPVAIEQRDFRYRLVREAERHDLMEAVGRTHFVWLFVFEHNDLLAERNTVLTSAL